MEAAQGRVLTGPEAPAEALVDGRMFSSSAERALAFKHGVPGPACSVHLCAHAHGWKSEQDLRWLMTSPTQTMVIHGDDDYDDDDGDDYNDDDSLAMTTMMMTMTLR